MNLKLFALTAAKKPSNNRLFSHLVCSIGNTPVVAATVTPFHGSCRGYSRNSRLAMRNFSTSTNENNDDLIKQIIATLPSGTAHGNDVHLAVSTLRSADAVCFDVDSTVINEEGIDVLADFLGQGEKVAALTAQAMQGGVKFQDALQQRLDLLQPSKQQIADCLQKHPLQLTSGIKELVGVLRRNNINVYLVSGGFRIMIEPLADILSISKDSIYANTILFNDDNKYAGFDDQEPTSRDMGKPAALTQIQANHQYKTMLMVGDGATDAQAKPPAKAFIGFGGVVVREAVKEKADWFVTDFKDMIHVLEYNK